MSQHDMVVDNNTGRNVRLDFNDALAALVSNNSGDTEPTSTFPFMFWADTTNDILKIRNEADSGWITLGDLTAANLGALLKAGGTMTGVLLTKNAATVGTPDLAFAGDADTGIYSPGANLLGLIAAATELLRIDGVIGYVKLLGTKALQLTIGTTAQRPTGAEGLLRANSDTKKIEAYINAGWQTLNDFTGYAAIVGSAAYCTHADLATALADSTNVPAGSKVLVTASETVNSTISVPRNNIQIDFMPGVTFTKGSAGTGITIDGAGCRIKGGRFSGFTTAAITITATFQNNFVTECRFASCTVEVNEADSAPVNVIANNLTE